MNLEQLDELLRRYSDAERTIAAALVDLEARPTYKLVINAPLRGVTRDRLQSAVTAMPELWRAFGSLREVLDKARLARGSGHRVNDSDRATLEQLLSGPSIVVAIEQIPLEQRTLLGPTEARTQITPEQLLAQMSATFAVVRDGVAAVEDVWRDVVPRVDRANTTLDRLTGEVASTGAAAEPALDALRDAVHAMQNALAEDPLGVTPHAIERLDAATTIAEQRVAELTKGLRTLDGDIDRAGALLDEIRKLRADVNAAASEVTVKIEGAAAVVAVPAAIIDGPRGLSVDLDRVRALTTNWQNRRREIDAWLVRAEPLADQLRTDLAANQAPIKRRNELRGLLSAYRAKAARSGMSEDEEVAALARAADQELHTAPSDLDRAAHLVDSLGRALSRRRKTAP